MIEIHRCGIQCNKVILRSNCGDYHIVNQMFIQLQSKFIEMLNKEVKQIKIIMKLDYIYDNYFPRNIYSVHELSLFRRNVLITISDLFIVQYEKCLYYMTHIYSLCCFPHDIFYPIQIHGNSSVNIGHARSTSKFI